MDAINGLASGARRAQAAFDAAAQRLAASDLPTAANPDPTNPAAPDPVAAGVAGGVGGAGVDPAGQLVAMNVAADVHHVTTAALRSAFSLYRDSLDLLRD